MVVSLAQVAGQRRGVNTRDSVGVQRLKPEPCYRKGAALPAAWQQKPSNLGTLVKIRPALQF